MEKRTRRVSRLFFYTLVAGVVAGCAPGREDFYSEFSIRRGPVTVQSTVDVRVGQIVYYGPDRGQGLATEADVLVDGVAVKGVFHPGDWLPVSTSVGRHFLEARIYRVFQGQRAECIGRVRREFEVSALRRTAEMYGTPRHPWDVPGFWWRVEIGPVWPDC